MESTNSLIGELLYPELESLGFKQDCKVPDLDVILELAHPEAKIAFLDKTNTREHNFTRSIEPFYSLSKDGWTFIDVEYRDLFIQNHNEQEVINEVGIFRLRFIVDCILSGRKS